MRRLAVAALALLGLALPASCSLGLDETKLLDGGTTNLPDRPLGDGAVGDAAVDAGAPVVMACAADRDCVAPNACAKGKCDMARKACVFDVCRAACGASACDPATKTCGAIASYKYRPTQFPLGATVVGGAVAIHPWLFVALATGLTAFDIANPADGAPKPVPITGLGFVPGQVVASGSRLYVLGGQSGAGPSRVPFAYLDIPSDPFVASMTATTVLPTWDRPSEGIGLWAGPNGSALLVGPGGDPSFPSALVTPPLVEPIAITTTKLVPAAGTSTFVVSGSRVLMTGIANGLAIFAFVDGAGTKAPQTGPVTTLPEGPASGARRAATSTDGAVFYAANLHQGVDPTVTTRATRGYFLVPNATGAVSTAPGFDIEVYDVPGQTVGPNVNTIGPLAMLDATTAMIPTQARENGAQTAVQFARAGALVREADNVTPRRAVLPIPFGAIAAATGHDGLGYVLVNDSPTTATAYVFDPSCAP